MAQNKEKLKTTYHDDDDDDERNNFIHQVLNTIPSPSHGDKSYKIEIIGEEQTTPKIFMELETPIQSASAHHTTAISELITPSTNHTNKRESIVSDIDLQLQLSYIQSNDYNYAHKAIAMNSKIPRKSLQSQKTFTSRLSNIRQIDSRFDMDSQLNEGEDRIQFMLAHCISCAQNNTLDIYQVLSLRYYDPKSRRGTNKHPFKTIGINTGFAYMSAYMEALFTVITIALLQTMGLTVVIYKLLVTHLFNGDKHCFPSLERWREVYSMKMLVFLWTMVITISVGAELRKISDSGVNKVMKEMTFDEMRKLPGISLWALQFGQAVHYYACFWAIFGSYFIIFEENEDESGDGYASAGLEIILNAVALFFMLELGAFIVTKQDYDDCEFYLVSLLDEYNETKVKHISTPDLQICKSFRSREKIANATRFTHYLLRICETFVKIVCYSSSVFAPFLVVVCW